MKDYEYAGFWERQLALVLDALIIALPVMLLCGGVLINLIYGAENVQKYQTSPGEFLLIFYKKAVYFELALFAIMAAIMAGFSASKWQATPGKKILGLKVIKSSGGKIDFWNGFMRYLSFPLVTLLLQTPERYMIYNKIDQLKPSEISGLENLAAVLFTPISNITNLIVIGLSLYWVLRVAYNKEKTALHDIMFDTRVVKAA